MDPLPGGCFVRGNSSWEVLWRQIVAGWGEREFIGWVSQAMCLTKITEKHTFDIPAEHHMSNYLESKEDYLPAEEMKVRFWVSNGHWPCCRIVEQVRQEVTCSRWMYFQNEFLLNGVKNFFCAQLEVEHHCSFVWHLICILSGCLSVEKDRSSCEKIPRKTWEGLHILSMWKVLRSTRRSWREAFLSQIHFRMDGWTDWRTDLFCLRIKALRPKGANWRNPIVYSWRRIFSGFHLSDWKISNVDKTSISRNKCLIVASTPGK